MIKKRSKRKLVQEAGATRSLRLVLTQAQVAVDGETLTQETLDGDSLLQQLMRILNQETQIKAEAGAEEVVELEVVVVEHASNVVRRATCQENVQVEVVAVVAVVATDQEDLGLASSVGRKGTCLESVLILPLKVLEEVEVVVVVEELVSSVVRRATCLENALVEVEVVVVVEATNLGDQGLALSVGKRVICQGSARILPQKEPEEAGVVVEDHASNAGRKGICQENAPIQALEVEEGLAEEESEHASNVERRVTCHASVPIQAVMLGLRQLKPSNASAQMTAMVVPRQTQPQAMGGQLQLLVTGVIAVGLTKKKNPNPQAQGGVLEKKIVSGGGRTLFD